MSETFELPLFTEILELGRKISSSFEQAITGWVHHCFPDDEVTVRFVNGEVKLITQKPLQLHQIARFMQMFDYGHIRANRYMTCIVYTLVFE